MKRYCTCLKISPLCKICTCKGVMCSVVCQPINTWWNLPACLAFWRNILPGTGIRGYCFAPHAIIIFDWVKISWMYRNCWRFVSLKRMTSHSVMWILWSFSNDSHLWRGFSWLALASVSKTGIFVRVKIFLSGSTLRWKYVMVGLVLPQVGKNISSVILLSESLKWLLLGWYMHICNKGPIRHLKGQNVRSRGNIFLSRNTQKTVAQSSLCQVCTELLGDGDIKWSTACTSVVKLKPWLCLE